MTGIARPLIAGFAGAAALTAIHQAARRSTGDAPRMDVLGRRALARGLRAAGVEPPGRDGLQAASLAGDLVTNGLLYGAAVAVGDPASPRLRGAAAGLAVGIASMAVAPALGLGEDPRRWPARTRLMAAAWYTLGGLVAGECYRRLSRPDA